MDEKRRILLLKIGFFPVTDDFWYGAEMPYAAENDCTWALRTPLHSGGLMPFHEAYLEDKSDAELMEIAARLRCPKR